MKSVGLFFVVFLCTVWSTVIHAGNVATKPAPKNTGASIATPTTPILPTVNLPRVLGVTIDNVDNITAVIAALKKLPVPRPTIRVVFDEYVAAKHYLTAVKQLAVVADVMGELIDSEYMKLYSVTSYKNRAEDYLKILGSYVAIWEIGNEVNGEWLGTNVIEKILAAHGVFVKAGKKVVVNFYYNKGCSENGHEMFDWINSNVPTSLRTGLDWVLFSYYEDDCNNIVHDAAYWEGVFTQLSGVFPTARLGFGEVGTSKRRSKELYVQRYYSLKLNHQKFIGGFFWWYFYQDMKNFPGWVTTAW